MNMRRPAAEGFQALSLVPQPRAVFQDPAQGAHDADPALASRGRVSWHGSCEATGTKMIPLSRRAIIGHGLEDDVLNYPAANSNVRPPVAVFISQPYRGLPELLALWAEKIHPAAPDARLRIYASSLKDVYKRPVR